MPLVRDRPHLLMSFESLIFFLGATGIAFCQAALKAGHELTIYARSPRKLPREILEHRKVNVIEGQLDNEASLKNAVHGGAKVFVSFAGPVMSSKGTVSLPPYLRSRSFADRSSR